MASGTTDIRDLTAIGLGISKAGIFLIFLSLISAFAAAYYSRVAANNDITRNEIELAPVLTVDVLEISPITQHCVSIPEARKWWSENKHASEESNSSKVMQVLLQISNNGKGTAENIMLWCMQENSNFLGADQTRYDVVGENPTAAVTAIAGDDMTTAYFNMRVSR